LSSAQYCLRSTDHEAPHVVLSTPCYFVPLRPKHSPQDIAFTHSYNLFLWH
jgi:hypothetical protein